ncbi:hypothetical protein CO670_01745 [Rhizobium sp. J15]|uniref:hypothetical protein n=1 Tax=Rhizobium sp. J15 TaxID=2035450 RepID=UPI000BE995FB|nr:hypothetical protein [Rhizobium sp. J15]PDT18838.1 hypothetical protein CO670_01745 [Rhizobium sp. J15]
MKIETFDENGLFLRLEEPRRTGHNFRLTFLHVDFSPFPTACSRTSVAQIPGRVREVVDADTDQEDMRCRSEESVLHLAKTPSIATLIKVEARELFRISVENLTYGEENKISKPLEH